MAKMKSSFVNMVVVLSAITCLSGAILGGMSSLTFDAITASKAAKQENAIKAVMTGIEYNNNPVADKWETTLPDGTVAIIFPAKMGNETVGAAVQAVTKKGFSGEITIMVGFNKEGDINEYSVLSHAETPGLGSKMPTWFKSKAGDILGKNPAKNNLTVSKDGGEIDAITAATISSRAFLDAVANAYNAFTGTEDAQSGATSKTTSQNIEKAGDCQKEAATCGSEKKCCSDTKTKEAI